MKIYNCHSHSMHSHDGTGTLEEICTSAINSKLAGFAITDHCDCELYYDNKVFESISNSFKDTLNAKNKYDGKLTILCSVEIGETLYSPDFANKIISSFDWDMILCSVHAVRLKDWDMPFSLIDFSVFDDSYIDSYIDGYFNDLLETAKTADYDVLCHLTVVLRYIVYKYKRKVNHEKYTPVITEILKTVISRDKALEVNTSGIDDGYFMPDKEILLQYKKLGGTKITLGSDSHSPDKLTQGLDEGAKLLRELGFDTLTYYINRTPVEYKI